MRKAFIYALCEPGSRSVRYIGKTFNLQKRFQGHITKSSKAKNHLGCWLRGVLGAGKVPALAVLCETTEDSCDREEIRYIAAARAIGIRLTNATDGGEGVTMTPETRAKISAKNRNPSPETRAKMGAARRGRKFSSEHRAKLSAAQRGNKNRLGRKHSTETRAKIGAAHRGQKRSEETRAKMSATHSGKKVSLGARAKLSAAKKLWWERKKG